MEGGRTYIYVNGRKFIQCIRLVLNIPNNDVHLYDEVDSIDEAATLYNKHVFQNRIVRGQMALPLSNQRHDITPEQEFWGHCSNIQAWIEHEYDTRILMSNISFPLLRELAKAGDPKASKIFKEEIALRLESGYPSVVQYLLNQGYIKYFTASEFKTIIETTDLIKGLSSNPNMLARFLISCGTKFPTVLEEILLQILKLPERKTIILSSMNITKRPRMLLMESPIRSNPKYLVNLKTTLEKIFKQSDEEMVQDIIDCLQAINTKIEREGIRLPYASRDWENRYEAIRNFYFDENVLNDIGEEKKLLLAKKLLNAIPKIPSKCSYCGKVIPKGQDTCEWCGHKRDDEGGFFPYPYIFKPPGGGGSMKGTIAVAVKTKSKTQFIISFP